MPSTKQMASRMLLLPLPLSPVIALKPGSKPLRVTRWAYDLKPSIMTSRMYILRAGRREWRLFSRLPVSRGGGSCSRPRPLSGLCCCFVRCSRSGSAPCAQGYAAQVASRGGQEGGLSATDMCRFLNGRFSKPLSLPLREKRRKLCVCVCVCVCAAHTLVASDVVGLKDGERRGGLSESRGCCRAPTTTPPMTHLSLAHSNRPCLPHPRCTRTTHISRRRRRRHRHLVLLYRWCKKRGRAPPEQIKRTPPPPLPPSPPRPRA